MTSHLVDNGLSGADPGLCEEGFEFVSAEGARGVHGGSENFNIWNVRDAISWAFRVNLREKGGLTEPIEPS